MEQMVTDQLSDTNLQVDYEVREHLAVGTKWSKFISVTMFVVAGIFLLIGLVASSFLFNLFGRMGQFGAMAGMSGGVFIIVMLLVVAVFVVLNYFLFNFSKKIREALATGNSETMNTGLSSLKTYFIIYGIIGILSLLGTIYTFFKSSNYL